MRSKRTQPASGSASGRLVSFNLEQRKDQRSSNIEKPHLLESANRRRGRCEQCRFRGLGPIGEQYDSVYVAIHYSEQRVVETRQKFLRLPWRESDYLAVRRPAVQRVSAISARFGTGLKQHRAACPYWTNHKRERRRPISSVATPRFFGKSRAGEAVRQQMDAFMFCLRLTGRPRFARAGHSARKCLESISSGWLGREHYREGAARSRDGAQSGLRLERGDDSHV